MSAGFMILFLIMLLMKTHSSRISRFWWFLSCGSLGGKAQGGTFLLLSHCMMHLVMKNVRKSFGSSTAFASLFTTSSELSVSSRLAIFSKYLVMISTQNSIFRLLGDLLGLMQMDQDRGRQTGVLLHQVREYLRRDPAVVDQLLVLFEPLDQNLVPTTVTPPSTRPQPSSPAGSAPSCRP